MAGSVQRSTYQVIDLAEQIRKEQRESLWARTATVVSYVAIAVLTVVSILTQFFSLTPAFLGPLTMIGATLVTPPLFSFVESLQTRDNQLQKLIQLHSQVFERQQVLTNAQEPHAQIRAYEEFHKDNFEKQRPIVQNLLHPVATQSEQERIASWVRGRTLLEGELLPSALLSCQFRRMRELDGERVTMNDLGTVRSYAPLDRAALSALDGNTTYFRTHDGRNLTLEQMEAAASADAIYHMIFPPAAPEPSPTPPPEAAPQPPRIVQPLPEPRLGRVDRLMGRFFDWIHPD